MFLEQSTLHAKSSKHVGIVESSKEQAHTRSSLSIFLLGPQRQLRFYWDSQNIWKQKWIIMQLNYIRTLLLRPDFSRVDPDFIGLKVKHTQDTQPQSGNTHTRNSNQPQHTLPRMNKLTMSLCSFDLKRTCVCLEETPYIEIGLADGRFPALAFGTFYSLCDIFWTDVDTRAIVNDIEWCIAKLKFLRDESSVREVAARPRGPRQVQLYLRSQLAKDIETSYTTIQR